MIKLNPVQKLEIEVASGKRKEVEVCKLARGARFLMPLLRSVVTGTFVESTECSAKVLLDNNKPGHTFTAAGGKQIQLPARKKLEYWWPGALVIPTGEVVEIREQEAESQFENLTGDDNDMKLPGVHKAASGNGNKKHAGTVRTKKERVADHPCLCGCGELCAGRFKMGHDGTFYKQLRQLIKGEVKFGALPSVIRNEVKNEAGAKAYLKSHGH